METVVAPASATSFRGNKAIIPTTQLKLKIRSALTFNWFYIKDYLNKIRPCVSLFEPSQRALNTDMY